MLARHPGGRPLTLTLALVDELADMVERGVPLEAAATARGFSLRTLSDWLAVGNGDETWRSGQGVDPASLALCQSLARSVRIARARREEKLALSLNDLAETGTREDTVRLKAVQAVLQTHPAYRDRWGQHVTIQQQGTVDHRHLHVELSAEEARAMAERLHAAELPNAGAPGGGKGSGGVEQQ